MDIGSELRQARQARGLSIEALAGITRIQPRVLDAIERNDLTAIPPPPYARGFVAAYAREVGLNPDRTARAYFAQFEGARPGLDVPARPQPGPAHSRLPIAVTAATLLAVTAMVMFWQPDAAAPPAIDAVGTSGTAAPGTGGMTPAADRAARAVPATDAVRVSPAPSGEEVRAVLHAERPAWIAATVDGERVIYRIVEAGTTETLRARQEITIRVGDAGAVLLSVNDGPRAPMGRSGQVRDVTLTAGAVR